MGLALIQTVALPRLGLFFVRPDLVLLGIIAWGLVKGAGATVWGGLTGALLLDLMSEALLGTSLLSLLPVLFIVALTKTWLTSRDLLVAMAVAFTATLIYDASFVLVLDSLGRPIAWGATIASTILPAAILNTLLMPLVCGIVWWLDDRTAGRRSLAITRQGSNT